MKTCNFNPSTCPLDCKKYNLCSYYSIQGQVSNIQSQLNFIYDTVAKILKSNENADLKLSLLESAFYTKIITDSEMKNYYSNKESNQNEKED